VSDASIGTGDTEGEAEGASPVAGHVEHVTQSRYELLYMTLALGFIAMLMLTNIIGTKLFVLTTDVPVLGIAVGWASALAAWIFGGEAGDSVTLTAGIVTYPVTFLFTDIVSEVYGRKRADRMVLMGFGASLLMLGVLAIGRVLPPSPFWSVPAPYSDVLRPDLLSAAADGALVGSQIAAQAAYQFTFDAPGTLLFASMTAYLAAQLVDNRLFHFWRRLTRGKALWFRNNMSTTLSQLVDTIIVNVIFLHFYWKMDWAAIGGIIVAVYVLKAFMAAIDTPVCYLGVHWARRLAHSERAD